MKDKQVVEKPKYPIQKKLRSEPEEMKIKNLNKKYIELSKMMISSIKEFADDARNICSQLLTKKMEVSNALISRIKSNLKRILELNYLI